MICTDAGIGLKKAELAALLAFCKKNKKDQEASPMAAVLPTRHERYISTATWLAE